MNDLTATMPLAECVRLKATAIAYAELVNEQIPELRLAILCLIIMAAGLVAVALLLTHECKENKQLRDVINGMHREDLQRAKFPETEKEAFADVKFEKHGGTGKGEML